MGQAVTLPLLAYSELIQEGSERSREAQVLYDGGRRLLVEYFSGPCTENTFVHGLLSR